MADEQLGEVAAQDNYDPFAAAALRLRRNVGVPSRYQEPAFGGLASQADNQASPVNSFLSGVPSGVLGALAEHGRSGTTAPFAELNPPETDTVPAQDVHQALATATSGLPSQSIFPQPEGGRSSRYGSTIGEMVGSPANYVGPGSIPAKTAWNVASGLASEAGGQLYEGTKGEPVARLLGAWGPAAAERAITLGYPMVPQGSAGAVGGKLKQPAKSREVAPVDDEEVEPVFGELARPSINEKYFIDPQRIYKPGTFKRPDVLAAEANAMVAPEHPALYQLFGVHRDDLYNIGQQGTRQGNAAPNIWFPNKPGGSYAAENIMTPANAQRLLDTLGEARKYPGLERGMVPWYVMDPAFWRIRDLVGPERAAAEYDRFNSMMTPFSASSDVMKEINRGTAANMAFERGMLPEFRAQAGMPVEKRGANFPSDFTDVIPHLRHNPTHMDPVMRWAATGQHGYKPDTVKIPLYTQASGVPETGFQTAWAVPDAHFTRAVGMSDVRQNAGPGGYMGGSEYRTFAPWFRENVSKPLGIEAVPTQALLWGSYAPQTGVKTPIGASKLELLSQRIWERAQKLGIDPRVLRDKVLLGQEHAQLEDNRGLGSLAALDNYA